MRIRSPRTVQQMHPLFISNTFFVGVLHDEIVVPPSSPNSLMTTAYLRPGDFSGCDAGSATSFYGARRDSRSALSRGSVAVWACLGSAADQRLRKIVGWPLYRVDPLRFSSNVPSAQPPARRPRRSPIARDDFERLRAEFEPPRLGCRDRGPAFPRGCHVPTSSRDVAHSGALARATAEVRCLGQQGGPGLAFGYLLGRPASRGALIGLWSSVRRGPDLLDITAARVTVISDFAAIPCRGGQEQTHTTMPKRR